MGVILLPVGLALIFGWPFLLVETIKSGFESAFAKIEDAIGEFIDLDRLFG